MSEKYKVKNPVWFGLVQVRAIEILHKKQRTDRVIVVDIRAICPGNGVPIKIEHEYPRPSGDWTLQGGVVRIDVNKIDDLDPHIPFGNEAGANEFWHQGGYTSGGAKELVIDEIPERSFKIHFVITE